MFLDQPIKQHQTRTLNQIQSYRNPMRSVTIESTSWNTQFATFFFPGFSPRRTEPGILVCWQHVTNRTYNKLFGLTEVDGFGRETFIWSRISGSWLGRSVSFTTLFVIKRLRLLNGRTFGTYLVDLGSIPCLFKFKISKNCNLLPYAWHST